MYGIGLYVWVVSVRMLNIIFCNKFSFMSIVMFFVEDKYWIYYFFRVYFFFVIIFVSVLSIYF